jgi:N,N'-diacetyllegionaminate synthase
MTHAIRQIEQALGDGIKKPSNREKGNIPVVRKSIIAARKIKAGEIFNAENMTTKRPGTGVSPMKWDEIIGKVALKEYQQDDLI